MDLNTPTQAPHRLWRLPVVIGVACRGKAGIYADMHAGTFPKPIKVGKRAVAWLADEVEAWVAKRVDASRAVAN